MRSVRTPRLDGRLLPLVALCAGLAAVAAYVVRFAWRTNIYAADELYNVVNARLLARDFGLITNSAIFTRGPERLISVVLAVPAALVSSTPGQMRLGHLLLALTYLSAAFPVHALARGLGVPRWGAALVALAAVVTPWALFGTLMLNVTLGYPLTMAFAWAAWRTAVRPSVLGDALAIGLALANGFARTGHVPFAAAAILVVLWTTWHRRPAGEPVGQSLRRFPPRLLRTHPLLVGVSVFGALVVLALGPARVIGPAYAPLGALDLKWQSIWQHAGLWFAYLTEATGYLPVVVGVPYLLREAVRPRSPEVGAFAVLALGLFVIFCYVTGHALSPGEERYVAVLAGLPLVAFGAALARREAWVLGSVVVGLLAARAVAVYGIALDTSPFAFQIAPAREFFTLVVLNRLRVLLPFGTAHVVTIATLGFALLGVVVAAAFSPRVRRPWRAVAARRQLATVAALVPVLVVGATSGAYALHKYAPATLADKTFERMAWIEDASGGAPVMIWASGPPGAQAGRTYEGLLGLYFNDAGCCNLILQDLPSILGPDGQLPRPPDLRYVARFEGYQPVGFDGDVIRRSTEYGTEAMVVQRLRTPGRAAYSIHGPGLDGALPPGRAAAIVPYSAARRVPGTCLRLQLGAAPGGRGRVRWSARAGSTTRTGAVRHGTVGVIELPLRGRQRTTVRALPGGKAPLFLGTSRLAACRAGAPRR